MNLTVVCIRLLAALFFGICLGSVAQAQVIRNTDLARSHPAIGQMHYESLLSYLRCDTPVRRDEFGQAAKPEALLEMNMYSGRAPSGAPTIPLAVWSGITAQVEVFADYGTFVVIQHYPANSKSMLLDQFSQAGWIMVQKQLADSDQNSMRKFFKEAKLINVLIGSSTDTDLPRTLTLIEASFDLSKEGRGEFPYGRDGVTVVCGYSRPTK